MKKMLLPVLIITMSFPMLSCAASFDCTKASSTTEKLICGDESLSELDKQLASSYKLALESATDKDGLKAQQRDWLKQNRNLCGDATCLTQAYKDRITELKEPIAKTAATLSSAASSQKKFSVRVGMGYAVCEAFNNYLNSSYNKKGDCFVGKYPPDKRLKPLEFKPVDVNKYRKQLIKYGVDNDKDFPGREAIENRIIDKGMVHLWEVTADLDNDGSADSLLVRNISVKEDFEKNGCSGLAEGDILRLVNGNIDASWGSLTGRQLISFYGKTYILVRSVEDYFLEEPEKEKPYGSLYSEYRCSFEKH